MLSRSEYIKGRYWIGTLLTAGMVFACRPMGGADAGNDVVGTSETGSIDVQNVDARLPDGASILMDVQGVDAVWGMGAFLRRTVGTSSCRARA